MQRTLGRMLGPARAGRAGAAEQLARGVFALGLDTWVLADELWVRGEPELATAVAERAVRQPAELQACLPRSAEDGPGSPARVALEAVSRAAPVDPLQPAAAAQSSVAAAPGSILDVRLHAARAHALGSATVRASEAWERTAAAAARLGWRDAELRAWQAAAACAERACDARAACARLGCLARCLAEQRHAELHVFALLRLARWTAHGGDLPQALGVLEAALRSASRLGAPASAAAVERERALWLLTTGELAAACDARERALRWDRRADALARAQALEAGAEPAWRVDVELRLALGDPLGAQQALARAPEGAGPARGLLDVEVARVGALQDAACLPRLRAALEQAEAARDVSVLESPALAALQALALARAWSEVASLREAPCVAGGRTGADPGPRIDALAEQAWRVLDAHGLAAAAFEARVIRTTRAGIRTPARSHDLEDLERAAVRLRLAPLGLRLCVARVRALVRERAWAHAVAQALEGCAQLERLGDGLSAGVRAQVLTCHQDVASVALEAATAVPTHVERLPELWLRVLEARQGQAFLHSLAAQPARTGALVPGRAPSADAGVEQARQRAYSSLLAVQAAGDRSEQGERRLEAATAAYATQLRAQRDALDARERHALEDGSAGRLRPLAPTLPALQASLRPHEVCVAYAVHCEGVWALVVEPAAARLVRIATGAAATASLLDLADRLAAPAEVDGGPALGAAEGSALAGTLRALLLQPLDLPEGTAVLQVVPDAQLACLPWAWIVGPAASLAVTLRPSLSGAGPLHQTYGAIGRGTIALGAPMYPDRLGSSLASALRSPAVQGRAPQILPPLAPLPFTEDEAREAASRPGDRLLLGEDASEERLWASLGSRGPLHRWRCLHLAAHGWVEEAHPADAMLALTPTRAHDGLLTAAEVASGHVNADLVILSACRSGRGRRLPGEALLGLARAFLEAGAGQVVASLWDVPDGSTRSLMQALHAGLDAGVAPAEALRAAQEVVRARDPRPAAWAGWVLWSLAGRTPSETQR